ncbi:cobalamin synthesis protein P47K [Thermincola ferriacetica]|uniref:Cobalamin synthesis protein P47K n=1 Tax=Thermincola ferriacetica TaxID=281456 RepID=A0A0L6W0L9_9FIRM|nr:GTP-binding protein [Thermincola ferriacetica]KNZ69132.1 cobalamin synthesis protein P47K [Thermincola ferriacetica]
MKIQLICGFLGAGKTTFLKKMLRQQAFDTVVLVNELGELGIDGDVISEGGNFSVVELPSGCICCTLRKSMVDAVREIMEKYAPGQLLIEPSGIASPSSVILALKNADFRAEIELAPVVGIIDSVFFVDVVLPGDMDDIGEFFKDQILNSDIILLNKADLVDKEDINRCKEMILSVNPAALIIPTVYCQTELPGITAKGEVTHIHFSPDFQAESFIFPGAMHRSGLAFLLAGLDSKEYGEIFRAKGIVRTEKGLQVFDWVHGLTNFREIDSMGENRENRLVFIGREIDRARLEKTIRGRLVHGDE